MFELLEPDYMKDFVCDGTICTDTCCQEWDIVIDEETCHRYEKNNNPEFKKLVAKAIVHKKENLAGKSRDIACIRMGRGNRCLFLCHDGLCMIQRKSSEKHLSATCRTYPRVIHLWNEECAERALSISCPLAAKLILNRKTPLQFIRKKIAKADMDGLRVEGRDLHLKTYARLLRKTLVTILQDRKLPLTRRLEIADHFVWEAGQISGHHELQKAKACNESYLQKLRAAEENSPAEEAVYPERALRQLQLIRDLLYHRLQNKTIRPQFREKLERAIRHWQLAPEGKIARTGIAQYIEDQQLYQLFLLPKYSSLLENYFVNEVFKDICATEDGPAFHKKWFHLLLRFAIARVLLVTDLSEAGSELSAEQVIGDLQQTSRVVGHDALYLEQVGRLLGAMQEDNMQRICSCIIKPAAKIYA